MPEPDSEYERGVRDGFEFEQGKPGFFDALFHDFGAIVPFAGGRAYERGFRKGRSLARSLARQLDSEGKAPAVHLARELWDRALELIDSPVGLVVGLLLGTAAVWLAQNVTPFSLAWFVAVLTFLLCVRVVISLWFVLFFLCVVVLIVAYFVENPW